jgi:hypothetical protein
MVRVPSERKSHQEAMPPWEGCSATQWPIGLAARDDGLWDEAGSAARSVKRKIVGKKLVRVKMFWLM